MKVFVSLAKVAAARTLTEFLSADQLKFLKKWCVDGSVAKGDLQTPFKSVRKSFEKAGEYDDAAVPALFRGVNLSAKEFDTLMRTGELPTKGNVQSWTADASMAGRYANGSMNTKVKPFAVVFKKPKGTPVIIGLRLIARRVGAHFKSAVPYNKEFILPGEPLKSTEIVSVSVPGFDVKVKAEYAKTMQKLEADGFFVKPVPKLLAAYLKVTPKGKLTIGKRLGG